MLFFLWPLGGFPYPPTFSMPDSRPASLQNPGSIWRLPNGVRLRFSSGLALQIWFRERRNHFLQHKVGTARPKHDRHARHGELRQDPPGLVSGWPVRKGPMAWGSRARTRYPQKNRRRQKEGFHGVLSCSHGPTTSNMGFPSYSFLLISRAVVTVAISL